MRAGVSLFDGPLLHCRRQLGKLKAVSAGFYDDINVRWYFGDGADLRLMRDGALALLPDDHLLSYAVRTQRDWFVYIAISYRHVFAGSDKRIVGAAFQPHNGPAVVFAGGELAVHDSATIVQAARRAELKPWPQHDATAYPQWQQLLTAYRSMLYLGEDEYIWYARDEPGALKRARCCAAHR